MVPGELRARPEPLLGARRCRPANAEVRTISMTTTAADREIERLLSVHPKGFDLSLDRIARLLARLGNPERRLPPVIHIAGTNGKGSAAAFCAPCWRPAAIASMSTLRRIWSAGMNAIGSGQKAADGCRDELLADAVARAARANDGEAITVFEILTAVTFLLFSEHPADAAIIEVGLGGRFDATNVLERPACTVIMPVSLDHEAFLGDRFELIAAEKAGIIKPGRPVDRRPGDRGRTGGADCHRSAARLPHSYLRTGFYRLRRERANDLSGRVAAARS